MSAPLSSARIRGLLHELRRLTAERAKAETETSTVYMARAATNRREFEQARNRLETKHTTDRAAADREYEQAKKRANGKADDGLKAARNVHGTAREDALDRFQTAEEETNREYQESKWTQD